MEIVRQTAGLCTEGYRTDHRMMEIHFGEHTWMARAEIAALPSPHHSFDGVDDWDVVRPGGESWAGMHERVGRFLPTLRRSAVMVTHYGPARSIRGHYLGLTPDRTKRYKPPHAGIMRLSHGTEAYFCD